MRKATMSLEEAGDFFSPQVLAKILNVADARAYELARQDDFPKLRVGKKYLISKAGFVKWCQEKGIM